MTIIIGVAGKAGSGKDTAGAMIVDWVSEYRSNKVHKQNFADALKQYCTIKYYIPTDWFYDSKLKETIHPNWGVTPRAILQFEGTEATRDIVRNLVPSIAENFWIHRLGCELNDRDNNYAVICDVRFQNEANWILAVPGNLLINIIRPGVTSIAGITDHRSELGFTTLEGDAYYELLNDGSLNDLRLKLDYFLRTYLP
jgi:hypothetical protein